MNATIIYWYLFDIEKYNRYRGLLDVFYSKEDAYERVKNQ